MCSSEQTQNRSPELHAATQQQNQESHFLRECEIKLNVCEANAARILADVAASTVAKEVVPHEVGNDAVMAPLAALVADAAGLLAGLVLGRARGQKDDRYTQIA